jgi:hypothetical protein
MEYDSDWSSSDWSSSDEWTLKWKKWLGLFCNQQWQIQLSSPRRSR